MPEGATTATARAIGVVNAVSGATLKKIDEDVEKFGTRMVAGVGVAEMCDRATSEAIWTLVVALVRSNDDEQESIPPKLGDAPRSIVTKLAEKFGDAVRAQLATICWDHPQLVDMEWKVLKSVESDLPCQSGRIYADLRLSTLAAGAMQSQPLELRCDVYQLQDLAWKIKQARHQLNELRQQK